MRTGANRRHRLKPAMVESGGRTLRHRVRLFRNCSHLPRSFFPSLHIQLMLSLARCIPSAALRSSLHTYRLASDHSLRFAFVAARAMSTQIPKTMKAVQVGRVVPATQRRIIIHSCSFRIWLARNPSLGSDASAWSVGRSLTPTIAGAKDGRARGAHPR
jgi:hypothetical protein